MKKILLALLLPFILLTSCVSRKKTVLFQDGSKKMEYPSDEVQAKFTPFKQEYLLKPGDIINISIGSVTPVDFDFIQQYTVQMGEFLYLSQYTQKNGSVSSTQRQQQSQMVQGEGSLVPDRQAFGFIVDNNGNVLLPKIGNVAVAGKTMYDVERLLEDSLMGYFESPKVRIQVLNFQFTIVGEVSKQGRYTTFKDNTTIIEALTMAGFFTEFADRANVKIVRTRNNETTVTYVNLLQDDILASQNFFVYPDDIIVVAPLKAKFWNNYVLTNISKTLGIASALLSVLVLVYTLNKN